MQQQYVILFQFQVVCKFLSIRLPSKRQKGEGLYIVRTDNYLPATLQAEFVGTTDKHVESGFTDTHMQAIHFIIIN
jgi:hypothetical protein